MSKIGSYHIYIRPEEIFAATAIYHHHNHFLSARFEAEHKIKVHDFKQFRYHQNKDNRTGELVMEVEIDAKYVTPIAASIWKPFETGNPIQK